jgi:hypothetical protein
MMIFEPRSNPASHTSARVGILGGFLLRRSSQEVIRVLWEETDLDEDEFWSTLYAIKESCDNGDKLK